MQLSEAIRLGAMLGPQAFERYYDDDTGTCAMGAAFKAAGADGLMPHRRWPVIMRSPATCPTCGLIIFSHDGASAMLHATGAMVVHLNDGHRWTRERIADWVAAQEALALPASLAASDPHVRSTGNPAPARLNDFDPVVVP